MFDAISGENIVFNAIKRAEDTCITRNEYNGTHFAARVSTVPVLFILSALGSFTPLIATYSQKFKMPSWIFFMIKFFGSGVIIATGFIHLLAESSEALTNECLGAPFTEYPFAEGIALIAVFFIFFFDVIAQKKLAEKSRERFAEQLQVMDSSTSNEDSAKKDLEEKQATNCLTKIENVGDFKKFQSIYQKILNCIVLECGIVLHSIFVGLTLTISGDEFITLYVAIGFHQFFEGLGLGTRFATTEWPDNKKYLPWAMSLAYSLTTPFAAGIGLIVRDSYPVDSRTALITAGTFDAACAGILIYNSIAELMAFDFIHSGEFTGSPMTRLLSAYFCLSLGAFAMALIGKWA
ncbi:hypothetical protein KGF56_003953 [Candida oxycetoniae]|uniref:Uncharacterized protein n=1 Tax=Candida oxycetoniae TaxID=497107 RepID=A0AAI9WWJ9_9ASCO|nr:uncharacterized protein KGF56_003953 [Candida oxycetoniae]KAI3403247.1 hypothetical protein KGF56_003953 [Candida oxycetoniae]